MSVFTQEYRLRNADVDYKRRLRLSALAAMFQETSIAHTERLGMGHETTLDRGLLWVITLQRTEILRLPVYDETVRLETWAGKTMHVFFPRYYRMLAEDGSVLVEASAFWGLMDQNTRRLVFPAEHRVMIPAVMTGAEPPLPRVPKGGPASVSREFTVPYSYLDLNGHMNNTRYYDLAMDLLPAEAHEASPCRILTEFSGEACLGDRLRVDVSVLPDGYFLCGEAGRRIFRMELHYPMSEENA